jgi:hypothetical protein
MIERPGESLFVAHDAHALPAPLAASVEECWRRAQSRWSRFLLLARPAHDPAMEGIAQIDLKTRQVCLNGKTILEKGLEHTLEALLAHEIGHHVRYPGSLGVWARLRLMERSLIPLENYSLVNVFTDLLINEQLGGYYRNEFSQVYRTFSADLNWRQDPAFVFYLAVYEELWQREPGELMGPARPRFERAYEGYRAQAHVLAQDLFHLGPNVYTQFIYFLSVISRYIQPKKRKDPKSLDPYCCGRGQPSPEDWADALRPSGSEMDAVRRALAEGWIDAEQAERLGGQDVLERRIASLPGQATGNADQVPEIMAAYYRREADRYLFQPPPQRLMGEAIVPTTLEEWETGDPVQEIDWLATLVGRGEALGGIQPLKRERIADYEGLDVPLWQPRVEIYLDVSGSMPDPRTTRNAMTLAAQILTTATIRASGAVRALLYSSGHVSYWTWCRSEIEISRFIMHYIGAGTEFPFPVLKESVAECRAAHPIRIVITDRDFDHNYGQATENARIFAEAAAASAQLILLQRDPTDQQRGVYERLGARVVPVDDLEDFPKMAAALSFALFAGRDRGPV